MFLEAQKHRGLSRAQPCRKTPAIKKSQNFLTTADLFGREHRGIPSTFSLKLLELLFVGDALLIHALGELAVSLEDLSGQTPLVLVDKFHQKLPFLGIDFVDLRYDGTRNRHDRFRGQEGFTPNLVVKGENRNVVAYRCIHGVKNSFDTKIDEVVGSLLEQFRLLQDAVDEVNTQDEGNSFPRLFLGFGLHTPKINEERKSYQA